jgi:glucokinase
VRLGVDIGGTKVLGVLVDDEHRVVARSRLATPQGMGGGGRSGVRPGAPDGPGAPSGIAWEVVDVVARVVSELDPGGAQGTVPLGVGAPGMVDDRGVIRFSPNLPALAGADLPTMLAARLPGREVAAGNDATCATSAEHALGAGRGARNMVMVTLGTGIGGGFVADGRVVTGVTGFAGEVGHMVVDRNGPPCPCGGRGCWERYASGGGLGRMARDAAAAGLLPEVVSIAGGDPESVRGEHVTDAALAGDAGARRVLEDAGWWLALGLANLTALLDPERIVVGGGLAAAGDVLMAPARQAFSSLVEGLGARPAVSILPAALGEEAGAIGAALLPGRPPRAETRRGVRRLADRVRSSRGGRSGG